MKTYITYWDMTQIKADPGIPSFIYCVHISHCKQCRVCQMLFWSAQEVAVLNTVLSKLSNSLGSVHDHNRKDDKMLETINNIPLDERRKKGTVTLDIDYSDVTWASWCFKSPAPWLVAPHLLQANNKDLIKAVYYKPCVPGIHWGQ